jgi:hypothetical protein
MSGLPDTILKGGHQRTKQSLVPIVPANTLKRKVFLNKLENYSKPLGEKVHRKITLANFENSIAGVVEGRLIPIMRL